MTRMAICWNWNPNAWGQSIQATWCLCSFRNQTRIDLYQWCGGQRWSRPWAGRNWKRHYFKPIRIFTVPRSIACFRAKSWGQAYPCSRLERLLLERDAGRLRRLRWVSRHSYHRISKRLIRLLFAILRISLLPHFHVTYPLFRIYVAYQLLTVDSLSLQWKFSGAYKGHHSRPFQLFEKGCLCALLHSDLGCNDILRPSGAEKCNQSVHEQLYALKPKSTTCSVWEERERESSSCFTFLACTFSGALCSLDELLVGLVLPTEFQVVMFFILVCTAAIRF